MGVYLSMAVFGFLFQEKFGDGKHKKDKKDKKDKKNKDEESESLLMND
jgi:hypothetical protein